MDKLIEQFSFGLFFWQLLLFVGLLLLLKKFAWNPILDAVNSREDGIKDALASAEQAKKEMQNLNADNERLLKEARTERDAMMKEARELKEKLISDAKDEAKAEAAKILAQTQTAIQSEKQAAIADIKSQVAELSIGIAEKVVRKELANDKDQSQLIEQLLKEVTIS
ncbi:F0F1 ATP synthase subunit B [Urechidicola croceus]|uniref:ATP synthase subunit b n=1 Tax=Urechidicola croceus TaxID=1850246 RepID=A0A1D8P8Z7_9FLAO|nr:F0F1 ATP synthase subunit B [Urechidicola croceus]AOW21050.1 ATP synthase F0 subunit B [Urechidicola croceus]